MIFGLMRLSKNLLVQGLSTVYIEFFRVPDDHLGYLYENFLTTGMLLSIPMIVVGFYIFFLVNANYRNNS